MEDKDIEMPRVDEPTVEFRLISDKSAMKVTNEDINETLIEITGYDLQVNFNMQYLKTLQDIEAAKEGVAKLFGEIIMEKLLEHKNKQQ